MGRVARVGATAIGVVGISTVAILNPAATTTALADGVPIPAQAVTYTASAACGQPYVVPNGETRVQVDAIGSPGTAGQDQPNAPSQFPASGGSGGDGSEVVATISVTPGETLYVGVGSEDGMGGGDGGAAGNFLVNGGYANPPGNGGNGGAASYVTDQAPSHLGGSPAVSGCFPNDPLVVAAGGGGGGGAGSWNATNCFYLDAALFDDTNECTNQGGNGGTEAGAAAQSGSGPGNGTAFGLTGTDNGAPGGAGSTGGKGGAAGSADVAVPPTSCNSGWAGWPASQQADADDQIVTGPSYWGGIGGFAAQDQGPFGPCPPVPPLPDGLSSAYLGGYAGANSGGGGGGGGGYVGGGGGGGADDDFGAGGGGGAGESYVVGQTAQPTDSPSYVPPSVTITPVTVAPSISGPSTMTCDVDANCSATYTYTGYPDPATSATLPPGFTTGGGPTQNSFTVEGSAAPALVGSSPNSGSLYVSSSYDQASFPITINVGYGTFSASNFTLTGVTSGTTMGIGANGPLGAQVLYDSGYLRDVSSLVTNWQSSNTNVLTVDQTGHFTAVGAGTATISGEFGGQTASVSITVLLGDPISLSISPADPTVPVGGPGVPLTATLHFNGGTTQVLSSGVTWSAQTLGSGPPVVTPAGDVSATISGYNPGSLTFPNGEVEASYTEPDGFTISGYASIDGTVAHPSSLTVNAPTPALAPGATEVLQTIGTYPGGSTADLSSAGGNPALVTYSSSNTSIAAVDGTGLVTAASNSAGGAVTITATSPDGAVTGSTTITVLAGVPQSVTISTPLSSLQPGQTENLTATAHYPGGATQDVTSLVRWLSDAPSVVSVVTGPVSQGSPADGTLTADGTSSSEFADITAYLDGFSPTTTISITLANPSSITICPEDVPGCPQTYTVMPGSQTAYTALGTFPSGVTADVTSATTWKATTSSVASFFAGSDVLAANSGGGGSTTITATDGSGTGTATVDVSQGNPNSLSCGSNFSTGLGLTHQIDVTAKYSGGATVDVTQQATFSSGTPSVATVSSTGLVSVIGFNDQTVAIECGYTPPGGTLITNTTTLTVSLNSPTSISFPTDSYAPSMEPNSTQQLTVNGTFPGGYSTGLTYSVNWSSSNTAEFTVASDGIVTAVPLAPGGTSTITATSLDGKTSASVSLTNEGEVTVSGPTSADAQALSSYTSAPFTASGGSGNYTWTASNLPPGLALSSTSGSSVTITGTPTTSLGTTSIDIRATDAAFTSNYTVPDPYFAVTVTAVPQTVTNVTQLSNPEVAGTSITVSATSTSGEVGFTGNSACTISVGTGSDTLDFADSGTCVLTASSSANGLYAAATPVVQTVQVLATQTLSWYQSPPSSAPIGPNVWAASGVSTASDDISSSIPIVTSVDSSTTNNACTDSSNSITLVHVGTCVIDANQAAGTGYTAAAQLQAVIAVTPLGQLPPQITTIAPSNAVVGGTTYTPHAHTFTASGNPAGFVVDPLTTNNACSVTAGVVSFQHVGTCVIDAVQQASTDYTASPVVTQDQCIFVDTPSSECFNVGVGSQKIHFTSTAPSTVDPGDSPYTVTTTGGGSGSPVTLSLDATTTDNSCYLYLNIVFFEAPGKCVVDANQQGDADYTAAPQAQQTITVVNVHVAVSSAPFSAGASQDPTTPVTFTLENASGTPVNANSDIGIYLDTTSSQGVFSDSSDGDPVASVSLPAGSSSVTAYYADTAVGTPTISGVTTYFGTATQAETVTAGAINTLTFTAETGDVGAGQTGPTVSVQALDQFGNPVIGADVTLTDSLGGLADTSDASTCTDVTGEVCEVTDSTGTANFTSLTYTTGASGTTGPNPDTLTATGGSVTTTSDPFNVWPAISVSGVTYQPGGAGNGSNAGGTNVEIDGSGFTDATGVSFSGNSAETFTVVSDTVIDAVTPPGSGNVVDVTVSNNVESSPITPSDQYLYAPLNTPTVTLTQSSTKTSPNAPVVFTVKVNAGAGNPTPTGEVDFYVDGSEYTSTFLGSSGMTSTSIGLWAGPHQIFAIYDGDGNDNPVQSPTLNHEVREPVSISVSPSEEPATLGDTMVYFVTVNGNPGDYGTPGGSVSLYLGKTLLGAQPLVDGFAYFDATMSITGPQRVIPVYSGDANYVKTLGSPLIEDVDGPVNVTAFASRATTLVGAPVILKASLVPLLPSTGGRPTGSVTFMDGNDPATWVPLGTVQIPASGPTTLTTSSLAVGQHSIHAVYSGGGDYNTATSNSYTETIVTPSTLSLATSATSIVQGSSVTLTATVSGDPTFGTPTGQVNFATATGAPLGSATVGSDGTASLTVPSIFFPTFGKQYAVASYSGDGTFGASKSKAVMVTVLASTYIAVESGADPTTSPVLLYAELAGSPSTAPTGTVTFYANNRKIGSVATSGTEAQLPLLTMAPGTYNIIAVYSGDSVWYKATSAVYQLTVS